MTGDTDQIGGGNPDFSPVRLINGEATSPIVFVCEHAANRIPDQYDRLGLDAPALLSHAAWDPGALAVAERLSNIFDAPLVAGTVSRLVYDCNRPPEAPGAMIAKSEWFDIPGNADLDAAARDARTNAIYKPFHAALARTIASSETPPAIITIHSFTPVYLGKSRAVEIGILHDDDSRLADEMLDRIAKHTNLDVRRNEPYGPQDGVTHTLQRHALANGLPNVMIEIRNDLIVTGSEQQAIASMLARVLHEALAALGVRTKSEAA